MRRIARALHLRPQDDEAAGEPEAADEPDEEETGESPYAPPAYSEQDEMSGTRLYQRPTQTEQPAQGNIDFEQDDALDLPPLTQEDEAQAYAAAQQEEDAQDYPGMYYDQSMYMRPVQEEGFEEAGAQEEMPDDAQIDHDLQPEADEFDDPDWTEGENDVEWAQEIDPLALYDDPQTLSQLEQSEPIAEVIQTPSEEAAPSQGQPRRRRRRRLEAE